jgi:hypothetical protein
MHALARHYERARQQHPADELCVVFDIDGTIFDMRHLVTHVLLGFDRTRGTNHFTGLVAEDVTHHEDEIDDVLESLEVPPEARSDIAAFYRAHLWDREAILAASKPYEGVFGVIRWFQLQPRTVVALNTGRSHRMREDTLASLNTVGAAYRVGFEPDLLYTAEPDADVPGHKAATIRELRRRGLRVVAVVDNEPENLRTVAAADPSNEILLLHADTIFTSQRLHHDRLDGRLVAGRSYGLRELVPEASLTGRVEFVWHGVNEELNLERFLSSGVRWAEIDVRRDPAGRLVLRHDSFEETPWRRQDRPMLAEPAIRRLATAGRSIKLDLKENATMGEVTQILGATGLTADRVWFNAELPTLGRDGFRSLRTRYPRATISAPVDFMAPLMLASASTADRALGMLRLWGVSRLSLAWAPNTRRLLDDLEVRGWEVNVYGLPELEAFLEASLLLPTSVTADFNFPEWRYFGRGSGAGGVFHPSHGGDAGIRTREGAQHPLTA